MVRVGAKARLFRGRGLRTRRRNRGFFSPGRPGPGGRLWVIRSLRGFGPVRRFARLRCGGRSWLVSGRSRFGRLRGFGLRYGRQEACRDDCDDIDFSIMFHDNGASRATCASSVCAARYVKIIAIVTWKEAQQKDSKSDLLPSLRAHGIVLQSVEKLAPRPEDWLKATRVIFVMPLRARRE
jgi:hypothetical protein